MFYESGADVNGLKGRQQSLNLQEPTEELYSIFDIMRRTYSRSAENCGRPQASLPVLVELYLEAGAKLNTTRWGPCLFYGYIQYTGKYSPHLFSPLSPFLSTGKFKTRRLPIFQVISFVNKRVFENLRRRETVCFRRAKLTLGENNPV